MESAFGSAGCTKEDVSAGLSEILPSLAVFQATQYALYRVRRAWDRSDPAPILPSKVEFRPTWDDAAQKLIAPNPLNVRDGLKANVPVWNAHFLENVSSPTPLQGKNLVADFEAKFESWKNVDLNHEAWRLDWSGKDVMQWLRIWLTAKFGWQEMASGKRVKLKWGSLSRAKRDAQDRPIEAAIRPILVRRLVDYIAAQQHGDIREEFSAFENSLRAYST